MPIYFGIPVRVEEAIRILNLDLENGTEVVSNIKIDTEMMDDEEQPEIILF